ncbi:MAG: hypothetical protein Q7S31_00300 [bacterium]|nr:hypothetical protein [bacterium]
MGLSPETGRGRLNTTLRSEKSLNQKHKPLLLFMASFLLVVAGEPTPTPPYELNLSSQIRQIQQLYCPPGDPLAGVHNPSRLKVIDDCVTITGRVIEVSINPDGDYTFRLEPDEEYAGFLTNANKTAKWNERIAGGCPCLQMEIIPRDLLVYRPQVGDEIMATGVYVYDKNNNDWAELHPIFHIEINE